MLQQPQPAETDRAGSPVCARQSGTKGRDPGKPTTMLHLSKQRSVMCILLKVGRVTGSNQDPEKLGWRWRWDGDDPAWPGASALSGTTNGQPRLPNTGSSRGKENK